MVAVAEALDLEAQALELGGAVDERLLRGRRQVEHHRHEQPLRLEPARP